MAPPVQAKTPLAPPVQNEASTSTSSQQSPNNTPTHLPAVYKRLQFDDMPDKTKNVYKESHEKRLKLLRKELEYIKETAWQYPPIETYIGH